MDFTHKNLSLKKMIEDTLSSLIDHDYVLWDVPYYNNIGDILIWEGERDFLKGIKHKCLDSASIETCRFPSLSADTVILLGGGGNFGDLWRSLQEFRLKVIRHYPDNRIIIFPQTVYYENWDMLQEDAKVMAGHDKLIICAREERSYEILKTHFRNEILLLPDMAFCIDPQKLVRWKKKQVDKDLFLKRMDKELKKDMTAPEDMEIRDWPSIERNLFVTDILRIILGINRRLERFGIHFLRNFFYVLADRYACKVFRPLLVRKGVVFLYPYRHIYTTRLHVMILSVLLCKKCCFIDNSYGKNSAFYEAWLKDLSEISPWKDWGNLG